MSVELIEPPKSKEGVIIGILVGLLNALVWIILGSLFLSSLGEKISIWWVLFCLILNIGVAFAIAQQRTHQFRRLYWIVGVALFIAIACAFILGFLTALDATDFGGLAFLVRTAQGGLIGLLIGIIVGMKTTPSNLSSVNIIQRIGEGIVTSTLVGIVISAISVFIFATSTGLRSPVDGSNFRNFLEHVFLNVLLITPAGAIPSVITGITASLAIYAMNWWLKRQTTFSK